MTAEEASPYEASGRDGRRPGAGGFDRPITGVKFHQWFTRCAQDRGVRWAGRNLIPETPVAPLACKLQAAMDCRRFLRELASWTTKCGCLEKRLLVLVMEGREPSTNRG